MHADLKASIVTLRIDVVDVVVEEERAARAITPGAPQVEPVEDVSPVLTAFPLSERSKRCESPDARGCGLTAARHGGA